MRVGRFRLLTGVDNPVHNIPPAGAHPNRGCRPDNPPGTLTAMTTTETQFVGIAAAVDLDVLLTADDFEPTIDVDTTALDTAIDALAGARALITRLEKLRAHLAAGGDQATAQGLAVDVRLTVERLDAITAFAL